jgi:APA family basic amino acid/polyamine antiporter
MLFGRVKSLDAVIATAEKKSLHRSLGPIQLTLLGVGAVIGTGIFVLISEAAQRAGPGMMISFVVAACVCAVAALCYAELSSMVPVAGSAYTYTYAVMGELLAWMVGWALILEYAVAASAVSVGWSGYFVGVLNSLGIHLPESLSTGPYAGGLANIPHWSSLAWSRFCSLSERPKAHGSTAFWSRSRWRRSPCSSRSPCPS